MIKKLLLIIYKLLVYVDNFFFIFTKKKLFLLFKDLIENDSYKNIKIINHKISFFVPNQLIDWRVNTFFSKEPETIEWIDRFSNEENSIFWDIGANIGLYSIYNAIKNTKSTTISFEPSTSNLRTLSRNISINNLGNRIKIFPVALTSFENSFLTMNEGNFIEGGALNSFGESYNFEGKYFLPDMKYSTFGTSINNLINNDILAIPNYIKIDVDGIEHLILQGADKVLESDKLASLSIEINENFNEQYTEVLRIMKEYRFRILHKKNNKQLSKNSAFDSTFNYIFIR